MRETRRFRPFPKDGRWTEDEWWAAIAEDLGFDVRPLLDVLGELFPAEMVKKLNDRADRLHPLSILYISRYSRRHLLEIAAAFMEVAPGPETQRAIVKKLHNRQSMLQQAAELHAGQLLARANAMVTMDPTGVDKLPDCIGEFPDGSRLAIEVKRPQEHTSRRAWARREVDEYSKNPACGSGSLTGFATPQERDKFRSILGKACQQLERAGMPGLILVDGRSGGGPQAMDGAILDYLTSKERGPRFGGLLVRKEGRFCSNELPGLDAIAAVGAEQVPEAFWNVFVVCEREHLHFDPFALWR
jgi:hypothetical protein